MCSAFTGLTWAALSEASATSRSRASSGSPHAWRSSHSTCCGLNQQLDSRGGKGPERERPGPLASRALVDGHRSHTTSRGLHRSHLLPRRFQMQITTPVRKSATGRTRRNVEGGSLSLPSFHDKTGY